MSSKRSRSLMHKYTHGQEWTITDGGHTRAFDMCPTQYMTQLNQFYTAAINGQSFTVNPSC